MLSLPLPSYNKESVLMKARFTLLFLLSSIFLYSQSDRIQYSIEYSLSQTTNIDNVGGKFEPELASALFARVELARKKSSRFTAGVGFLQTRILDRDYSGNQPFKDEERHYQFDYLLVPVGIKFNFGPFYIHPEIGAGYNYQFKIKTYHVDSEMNVINGPFIKDKTPEKFEIRFSTLMSLGYEINVGTVAILTGVKGYIFFEPDFITTYGIGLMMGVKI
jgi:hypothetical protein